MKKERCPKCDTILINASGIGPYCPNKKCDVVDGSAVCITAARLRLKFDNDLKNLQDSCTHPKSKWMDYMWAPGHFGNPVRVCICCDKILASE